MNDVDNNEKNDAENKDKEFKENFDKVFRLIEKDKDRLYLISTKGIGDFLIVGGFSEAVQKRKNKKSTVLVIQRSKRNTGIFFPNVSGIMSCDIKVMAAFEKYFHETKNYEGDNYIYANIHKINTYWDWDGNLDMLDRLKKNALKIPLDSPFVYPIVDEIPEDAVAALYKKYILDKDRTIILLPHAKTFKKTLDKDFWTNIARRLREKKYIVYTNVAGDEEPLEGTEPFNVSFPELYHITGKVKCFLGINSGIFVFLAMTDAKMLTVNVFPHWFWDLSMMFPGCNNHTFYNTSQFTKELNEVLGKYDISAKMKYSQKNLAQEDIFYSDDDMLEAILKKVEEI